MISKVITTKELVNFDKHHLNYKESHSEESRKICRNLLPQLQVSVLKEHGRKNGQIRKWEKHFIYKTIWSQNQPIMKMTQMFIKTILNCQLLKSCFIYGTSSFEVFMINYKTKYVASL